MAEKSHIPIKFIFNSFKAAIKRQPALTVGAIIEHAQIQIIIFLFNNPCTNIFDFIY